MAAIAVVHVFISHFAIGGGLYLVVTEHWARRRNDAAALAYLERLSRFFVLTTLVAGALTGVGIWFVIGLLNPAATELLIHHFVWGWAIEWTFFAVEILAAILYYYGWRRMGARAHLALGWIYFVAAWLSL
ncbi:MAG TPA: cytochrome ubiquinol oxidase subunit I, partial [Thermoanaerobaculia bacterium]|nr:cytochrome ubiquinol oxidase subunit I [Thermoanaerobaculia bacterium]